MVLGAGGGESIARAVVPGGEPPIFQVMPAKKKTSSKRRYGKAAQRSVKSAVGRAKRGTLKSGKGKHPKVKSRQQAIAIGLSEARKKGAKVPRKKKAA